MKDARLRIELELLRTEDGGRTSAVVSGFRPVLRFEGDEEVYGLLEVELDAPALAPGQRGTATIRAWAPEVLPSDLDGRRFEVMEGARVVGCGRVKSVEGPASGREAAR